MGAPGDLLVKNDLRIPHFLRKGGKRAIFRRHAAIIGGILGFAAGFGGCNATDIRPSGLAVALLAGAIRSLPGLGIGFFLGKKETTGAMPRASP